LLLSEWQTGIEVIELLSHHHLPKKGRRPMKTFWKISLAGALILLLSSGVALALSIDYTIDTDGKKYLGRKNPHAFNFDVDLENAVISSVTLSIKHKKNWNKKKKEIWGIAIGDDFYKLNKSQKKWKTITFDVTENFDPNAPFSIALIDKAKKKRNAAINVDWLALSIDYELIEGISDAVNGGGYPNGNNGAAPVPEPGTLVLLGAGLLFVARLGFRKLK